MLMTTSEASDGDDSRNDEISYDSEDVEQEQY